jgi:hypothetical protein
MSAAFGQVVLVLGHPSLVGLDPVAGNPLLRLGQADVAVADHFVNHEFEVVFLLGTPCTSARLRPEVFRVAGVAANAQVLVC